MSSHAYTFGGGELSGESALVHDPVGHGAPRRRALVVHQRLLESDEPLRIGGAARRPVASRGLPQPPVRRPTQPPAALLPVSRHVEVPPPLPSLANPAQGLHKNQLTVPPHATNADDERMQ